MAYGGKDRTDPQIKTVDKRAKKKKSNDKKKETRNNDLKKGDKK